MIADIVIRTNPYVEPTVTHHLVIHLTHLHKLHSVFLRTLIARIPFCCFFRIINLKRCCTLYDNPARCLRFEYFQLKECRLPRYREVLGGDVSRVVDVPLVVDVACVSDVAIVVDVALIVDALKKAHRLCDDSLEEGDDLCCRVGYVVS